MGHPTCELTQMVVRALDREVASYCITTVSIVRPSAKRRRYLTVLPLSATRLTCGVTVVKAYTFSS